MTKTNTVHTATQLQLGSFGLSDMIECGRQLRGAPATESMEDAAQQLAESLRGMLVDESGQPACALLRCFKTHRLQQLPTDLKSIAAAALDGDTAPDANLPCLTLIGSSGELPEWNGRERSGGHRAIPLLSVEMVERAPMIAQLIGQMGLSVADVLEPSKDFLQDAEQKAFNVFHVTEAHDSRYVPGQDFVRAHGIQSVLGFGGLLPAGDFFAVILFAKVPISREVADMFRTVALSTKLAFLPFSRGPVFREEIGTDVFESPTILRERQRSENATFRLLIPAVEDVAMQQTAKLETAVTDADTANRAKSDFLANMSHELRTPLSAVIGYSELLEEEMEESGEKASIGDVRKIQSNARHLLSLINNVLDLSKIEADKMTTFAEDFAVEAMVHEVANTMQGLVAQKENELKLELGEGLGSMHTDVVKLRQCLFNLIGNASKFTEKGCITLRVARAADLVTFSVIDSGIGMTEEQTAKLFERFAQADSSTTRKFGGTGLGLAITRAFSQLLGGDIEVSSVYGQGSTFTLHLPATLAAEAAQPAPEPAGTPDERQVVLVIDDDSAQRDLLTRFLEREGFAVRSAADGRTGIELAHKIRPRAILLDVIMPQMDGWAVLSAIKADPEIEHTPVVMVTFVNEPGLSEYLGATETVLKPVEWNQLKLVMERFRHEAGDILVVDDDLDTRARLRSILQKDGWTVTEAANGQEALDSVAYAAPKVVLLDLTMPIMDGFTFLHELRNRPGMADIPVVVYTARELDQRERERLGAADLVLKKGETSMRQLSGELRSLAPVHDGAADAAK